MEERRIAERLRTHLPAHWETASGVQQGIIVNGSAGGCFVLAQVEEPGDDLMEIVVQLPNGRLVRLWGEVAYYLPTEGFGLQFVASSDESRAVMKMWLDYLDTLEQQPERGDRGTTWHTAAQPAF
ncbi:MAG: PilZ domain-containing protein [Pyrinomonadaceae bacterium]|nr:PilZ domain-containing protein [Pyrinomonadaceae bacterium]